jgi:tetratricopeptide (TPR) repeat protein
MNTPDPEQRKLDIEEEKLRLARKGLRQDTFGKIVMPAVIVVLAAATYFGNTNMAERQHQLAIDVHKMQLRDKESQLGLRNEDAKAARNQRIQDFVRQEYQRITSDDPAVSQGAVAVAYAVFSDEPENTLVRAKISVLLADKQQRMAQQPTARQRADSELAVGQRQIVAGNFSLALRHLDTALTLDPSNPSSWNSKAYAQFRMKDGQGALSSISEAISLSPSDARLRRFVIINAAKILCSVGRTDDGLSYLNSGIAAIPNLAGEAREDKELTSTCSLISS